MPSTFELTGTAKLRKALEAAGALATQSLAVAGHDEMNRIINAAKALVPENIGNLKASGTVLPPEINGTRVEVTGGFGNAATKYAIWVHEGRRPGSKQPPTAAIKQWLHDKGGDEEAAFVIARAIGRRGIKARKFLERPFLEAVPGIPQRLAIDVAKAFERLRVQ